MLTVPSNHSSLECHPQAMPALPCRSSSLQLHLFHLWTQDLLTSFQVESSSAKVHCSKSDLSSSQRRLCFFAGEMCADVPNWPYLLPSEQLLLLFPLTASLQLDHETLPSSSLPFRFKMEPSGQKVCDPEPNLCIMAALQLHSRRMCERLPC